MSDSDFREATRDTYTFTPSVGADGFIDYTGVEPDKVYLANRKTILEEEYPSYLPPVHIRRNTNYDIPAYKVRDNVYLLRESDELRRDENGKLQNPRIYKVSLDVYAALVNYHLEFDRAAFLAVAKQNEESRVKALKEGINEYPAIREKDIPIIPGRFDVRSISNTYTHRYPHIEHKPSRVSLKSTKSGRMGVEAFYFIQDMNNAYGGTLNRGGIFRMHRECLDDVNQKILDMELQKADWESTWTKGRETSYGDTNLDDSLLQTYGIRVKRQNGENIYKKEIEELKIALDRVHSVFGNISDVSQAWGLKVSHAGNTKMHASKYIGLFTPYYRAIGISFAGGEAEASLTAIHEYAHFMDHLSGKELNAWHASDIPGTLENQIAVEFRGQMIDVKGAYWSRTCECFARAIEEYAQITHIRDQEVVDNFSLDSINKINAKIAKPGSVKYLPFKENIEPLVTRLLEQYRERYTSKQQEVSKSGLVLENTTSKAIPAIPQETTIEELEKEVYNLAVEKNRLDTEARSITEKINEERRILFEQELKRISTEIGAIDRKLLLQSESGGAEELARNLEGQKKELTERYNAVRYEFTPESEKLSAYREKDSQLNSRLQDIEKEGMRLTLKLMELEKKEETRKKDKREHSLLTGTFTQLELFEKAAEYSAQKREEGGSVTEIIEGDPTVTREHIREAKAAQRKYTKGILKGTKSGLWTALRDFKKHGVFDIQGAQVATGQDGKITREGWEQLHQALHIYRDKRFETFRVLFVTPDGVITDQLAISSHLPTRVALTSLNGELGDYVRDYAVRTNTKIVFIHNHPSGNVSPSLQDETMTKDLEAILVGADGRPLLLGHIILDHDSFGLYQANTWETMRSVTQGHDPLLKTRLPEFTQERINNPVVLRDIAEEINESDRWNSTDWVPVAFTGADARISGIRYYSKEWFETVSSNDMARQFQSVSVQTGAIWAFPIISDELAQDTQLCTAVKEHMKDGCFMDFYIAGATSEDFDLYHYRSSFFSFPFMTKSEMKERTTTEATFALEEQNVIIDTTDMSVASNEQEEHGGHEHAEKLFQTDISPGLSTAIANISKADIGKPNERIVITEQTPFVFTKLGLPNKSIEMYQDKIARSIMLPVTERHGHNNSITKENVLEVFSQIANPRAIFRSKDSISLIAVYDLLDVKNEPIMISLKNENRTIEANLVTSVYGKPTRDIEFWIEGGQLLYVNDMEKEKAFMLPSRQLRMSNINASIDLNILCKSVIVNSGFVQESKQEYTRGNGGRTMEDNRKEANSLESFVLSNEQDRKRFYASIGIDPAEPLFPDGKSLQDITSVVAGPQEYDESGFITRKEYVLSADDVLYAAFVSDKDHEQGTPLSSIHGLDSFLVKKNFNLDGIEQGNYLFNKALAERERFLETQEDLRNHQQSEAKEAIEEPKKSYIQLHTERILDSLKSSSAPFLGQPAKNASITLVPQAIRSAETGRAFRGMNQIIAQIMTQEAGGKDYELITYEQAKRHGAGIKKGSVGINLTTFDAATKHQNVYRYYPKSSVYNQEKLPKLPEQNKNPEIIVECNDTTPDKYLGKYLAATSLGARFETTKDTMEAFQKNLEEDLKRSYDEKCYTRIFELGNKASVICQNTMSEIGQQARDAEKIRQKVSESRSRYEPYNPVTGEKFVGLAAKKAQHVMGMSNSHDPRFLELSDILKAGLKLKEAVKEPLVISDNGKSRFFYNAKDVEGVPPIKIKTISLNQQRSKTDAELQL
ncbi:ssDNA-binding domain-containing protein [Treponema zuelzerae]|uniref:SsDNA-binding domain-containing protein n=1 Tax=Teretinema zuelzerae TaxID=156 RepID=A0AAE3EF95_9SPIR|nr:ArdC-like ssDNA-binding domain-containing protein [Teretinema zuelzerae]MCD1653514.1 ssDNA-binding domain-containing protein [Teretinema zuelzerae]